MVGAHASYAIALADSAPPLTLYSYATPSARATPSSPSPTIPLIRPSTSAPSAESTKVDLSNVNVVVAQILQESVTLLALHAETTAVDCRARTEKFTALRSGLKDTFAIPLIPERPKKRIRDSTDGPSEKCFADCLHNERSQGNSQLCISASTSSDKIV